MINLFTFLRGGSLIAATVCVGLMAGLFYSFAIAVMLGLRAADDRTFVGAMQRMNDAILGEGGLADGGRIVCVASIAGIAGNRGQTNYGARKAGVRTARMLVPTLADYRAAPYNHAAYTWIGRRGVQPLFREP